MDINIHSSQIEGDIDMETIHTQKSNGMAECKHRLIAQRRCFSSSDNGPRRWVISISMSVGLSIGAGLRVCLEVGAGLYVCRGDDCAVTDA